LKKIGLTLRVTDAEGYVEPRDALSHDWVNWVEQFGWLPVALFNSLKNPDNALDALDIDALILTGGNDSVPGAPTTNYEALRNNFEFELLDCAVSRRLPILAVCRGMHIVNLYFGGTVISDIGISREHHIAQTHMIRITDGIGGEIDTAHFQTNSFHSQGIRASDIARDLRTFAVSDDHYIEGIFHPTLPIIAVQWHPERPGSLRDTESKLTKRLFEEGAFWHASV
jgi:gamma-glutamyl-gamma-aminobutyrate hydrolase PuuD